MGSFGCVCTHMRLVVLLILAVTVQGRVYTCDEGVVELPGLLMGGMGHEELVRRLQQIETGQQMMQDRLGLLETEPAPWCPPMGSLMFLDGPAECPDGFTDVSARYAGRYVSVGEMPGTFGEAVDLETNMADVHRITTVEKPSTDAFGTVNVLVPNGPVQVSTAEVAPAIIVRACRRSAPC